MKFTDNYKLGSIEENLPLDPLEDGRRFITIDRQLLGLFQVFGNGVVSGWNVSAASGLSVSISPGRGHISFMSAETTSPSSVVNLIPNATNYIYATNTTTTRYNRATAFLSESSRIQDTETMVLLASVTTSGGAVTKVDESVRNDIGFIETIKTIVNAHRHRGNETDNPSRIDLSSEVMGLLPGSKIKELDASKITSGKIPLGRIPKLKHSDLIDRGTLTHAQLDSYVRNLSNDNARLLGELSTIDMIQLYLAHKHIWPDVDQYSSNMLLLIPGISPDGFMDEANSNAAINKTEHTIKGVESIEGSLLTTTFSTKNDFLSVVSQSNVEIGEDTDGAFIKIKRNETHAVVDDFDDAFSVQSADVNLWTVETISIADSSSFEYDQTKQVDGAFSAKLNVDQGVRIQTTKIFDTATDWEDYSEIEISIQTLSSSHGQIRFQILSADTDHTVIDDFKLLDSDETTDDASHTTTQGFITIKRDITSLDLTSIGGIRIYTDTSYGWDLSPFILNIDKIQLNNNLYFNSSGKVRFRLKTSQKSQWSAISWTEDVNDGEISVRARTATSYESLNRVKTISFSDFLNASGDDPDVLDNRAIEVEVVLTASSDRTVSPVLRSLTVSFITAAEDADPGITVDTATQFRRAKVLENAKVEDTGSVTIDGTVDVGNVVYGQIPSIRNQIRSVFPSFNSCSNLKRRRSI